MLAVAGNMILRWFEERMVSGVLIAELLEPCLYFELECFEAGERW
jgi:hypothetical protein